MTYAGEGKGKGKGAGARQRLRRCHWRPQNFGKEKSCAFGAMIFIGFKSFVIAGSSAALL